MAGPAGAVSPHLRALLRVVLAGAAEALGASAAVITLVEAGGWRPIARIGHGLSEEQLAALDPDLERLALRSPDRVVLGIRPAARLPRGPAGARLHRSGSLTLALRDGERLLGSIELERPLRGRLPRLTEHDGRLLHIFARQAVEILRVARLEPGTTADHERLQDLQNTFVSIVSHELQTPVAIIKGYAGALRRPDAAWSPAVVQRVAATIEAECDRLSGLITDLLDLARIQAGRVAMTFGPVDLAEMLAEVVGRARPRSPHCEIVLEDVRALPTIRGDHDKLRMALNNLVENAVKYSPRGGTIALGGAVRSDQVLVWVRDEGIGVPAAEHERIFERFHRLDTSLSRETPGVGMGLYICKVIVEAHNGRVWVESEGLGRGSTFYIELPLVKP